MTEEHYTKAQLLERINTAYQSIENLIRPLTVEQMARPGPEGWAIKDHLAHLASWELGMAELLQRHPRFAAMGIEEAEKQGQPIDVINELIYQQNASLTARQALDRFREVHQQFLSTLAPLSDADLYRPYADYLPEGEAGPHRPVMDWIAGNTFGHFEEHAGYIQKLV